MQRKLIQTLMKVIVFCLSLSLGIGNLSVEASSTNKTSNVTIIVPTKDISIYDDNQNIIGSYKKGQEYIVEQTINKYYMVRHENHMAYVKKENVTLKQGVKRTYSTKSSTNKFIIVSKNTVFKLVSNNNSYFVAGSDRRYPIVSEDKNKYYVLAGKKLTYVEKSKARVDKGIPVLMYHHLLKKSENKNFQTSSTMDVNLFEQHMKYMYDNKNITITPTDLELFLKGNKNLSTKAVLVTFDDGNKSGLVYAEPIMKKYKIQATNFIITSRAKDVDSKFHPDTLQFLSKNELKKISNVFNYGSHTNNLHSLSSNNNKSMVVNSTYEQLKNDLLISRNLIPAKYFAYPFGQYNNTTLKVLKDLDYRLAFTTKNGYVKKGDKPLELNRIGINDSITLIKFKNILAN